MKKIRLNKIVLEQHNNKGNVEIVPDLLDRWNKHEGYIPSEADIRILGIRNYKDHQEIAKNWWDSSTLSAVKNNEIKIILSYDNLGNHQLTDAAKFGLSLINPKIKLNEGGVNLNFMNKWEKLEGKGVYTFKREDLIINRELTKEEAMQHPLILTKFGHPNYVDSEFARSKDEVEEIIEKTFELVKKESGLCRALGQYLPEINKNSTLNAWNPHELRTGAFSYAGSDLGNLFCNLAFVTK